MILEIIADFWLELSAMLALMVASAFFSCSEAAYFSLSRNQRNAMGKGTESERLALQLLESPERLLTTILFWNLLINMTYFALASILTMKLQRGPLGEGWIPQTFAIGALLAMIMTSELVPKNLGVLKPRLLAKLFSYPLTLAMRVVSVPLPALQTIGNATARLLVPEARTESALAIEDLERAVELGSGETHDDKQLLFQERLVLQRIVDLASATVAELMRPRHRCTVLPPPGTTTDLSEEIEGEYLLFTEPDSDEIAKAVPKSRIIFAQSKNLASIAEQVVYVPWCATASHTLNLLLKKGNRVAVVINELGETIGILTIERLLDNVLRDATQDDPMDAHAVRIRLASGAWEATGATPLRKIAKRISRTTNTRKEKSMLAEIEKAFSSLRNVTVSGLMLEQLDRPPCKGDRIEFVGFEWEVSEGPKDIEESKSERQPIVVRIKPLDDALGERRIR